MKRTSVTASSSFVRTRIALIKEASAITFSQTYLPLSLFSSLEKYINHKDNEQDQKSQPQWYANSHG
jgi:hypothetical protein